MLVRVLVGTIGIVVTWRMGCDGRMVVVVVLVVRFCDWMKGLKVRFDCDYCGVGEKEMRLGKQHESMMKGGNKVTQL